LSVARHLHGNKSTCSLVISRPPSSSMRTTSARHICQTNANICTSHRHKSACLYTLTGRRTPHATHLLSVNNFSTSVSAATEQSQPHHWCVDNGRIHPRTEIRSSLEICGKAGVAMVFPFSSASLRPSLTSCCARG